MKKKNLSLRFVILWISMFSVYAFAYVPKEIKSLGNGSSKPISGRLTLKAPPIAENSAEVGISIDSIKLPSGVWVKELVFAVPYNTKVLARYRFNKYSVIKGTRLRLKLRRTTHVYAYAILSNGQVYVASQEIKITIGGCGNGGGSSTAYVSGHNNAASSHRYQISRYTSQPYSGSTGNSGVKNTEKYAKTKANGVVSAAEKPVSTFSIDVDTGSYANVRRFLLKQGQLPVKDSVRVEEMINYFQYGYKTPDSLKTPFSISTEVARTPWNKHSYLLRIGLKGYEVDRSKLPPANLVFLIDVSGSMETADKLPLLKGAIRILTNQLSASDRVSIVVYAGASGLVLPPTSGANKQKINDAMNRLRAGGSTNGGAGIELAYALAKQSYIKGGINRVIIATDGDFNVGMTNHKALIDLIKKKRRTDITLTTLGFGSGNYNDKLMEQLANHGNGNHAYIDTLKEANKTLVEQLSSTLFTIAKDVKIQVEFNPAQVAEYRLVGYENRLLKREDFNNDKIDAGDLGAGHTVTAIYEIVLQGSKGRRIEKLRYGKTSSQSASSDELIYVKLRYKKPTSKTSQLLTRIINKSDLTDSDNQASEDFNFAAAVAAFGQKLRGSHYLNGYTYADIQKLASKSKGHDKNGYRHEFISLVKLAEALSPKTAAKTNLKHSR